MRRSIATFAISFVAAMPIANAQLDGLPDLNDPVLELEPIAPQELKASLGAPVPAADPKLEPIEEDDAELITERYDNRKPKIQRYVRQDANRNYVNHGLWQMWDEEGRLLARGNYVDGKRQGVWHRMLGFHAAVSNDFQAPYSSQAEFLDGQLNGTWTMTDAQQRVIATWEFNQGKLDGKVVAWFSNGQQRSEMNFVDGQPHGQATFWNSQGKIAKRDFYRRGKRLIPHVERFDQEQLETEGWYIQPERLVASVDWWKGDFSIEVVSDGDTEVRTGMWRQWYANGTLRFEGKFVAGKAVGRHTWWHENGLRRQEGEYIDGLAEKRWTSWHDNGRKAIEGEFVAGAKSGSWTRWAEDGVVAQTKLFQGDQDQYTHSGDSLDSIELGSAPDLSAAENSL